MHLSPGVQSAAVNVICELARRNPKNYLSLAPLFFKLMTSSTNNWVLIKIIKLVSQHGHKRVTTAFQKVQNPNVFQQWGRNPKWGCLEFCGGRLKRLFSFD